MTMKYLVIEAPSLTDEATVNLHDFFSVLMNAFEDHYHYQMERYYRESVFGSAVDIKAKPAKDGPPF